MIRVLVAGMGNVLRRDDGFGVEVVRKLAAGNGLPPMVEVVDVGIGGIHLVQRLMDGYDVLLVVDAMDRGGDPGALKLLQLEVPDLDSWTEDDRRDFLADMHYATPSRALILARALGILPGKVYMLGCQAADYSDLGIGLTEPVQQAAAQAAREIERFVWEDLHGAGPADIPGPAGRAGEERPDAS